MSDVVVITGCSSGIGLETALAFARRHDQVFATMRDTGKSTPLLDRAADENLTIDIVELDVRSDGSVAAAVAEVRRAAGRIDVLVNNAGVGYGGPVEEMDPAGWQAVLDTNLYGPIRMVQAVVGEMRTRGSGAIVNIGSAAGHIPGGAFMAFYAASKHGIRAFTESLYAELHPFGITVRVVEPGFFASEIYNTASRMFPGAAASPYAEALAINDAFFVHSSTNAPGAAQCAAIIVQAVHDPAATVWTPAGEDAAMLATMAREATSVEEWTTNINTFVQIVAAGGAG